MDEYICNQSTQNPQSKNLRKRDNEYSGLMADKKGIFLIENT